MLQKAKRKSSRYAQNNTVDLSLGDKTLQIYFKTIIRFGDNVSVTWSRECQFGRMVINTRWWQRATFRAGERSLVRATGVGVTLLSSLTSGLLMGSINDVKDRAHSMLIKFADVTNLEAVAHTRRLRINTNGSNEITNTQRKEDN